MHKQLLEQHILATNEEVDIGIDGEIPLYLDDVTGSKYIILDFIPDEIVFKEGKTIINLGYIWDA